MKSQTWRGRVVGLLASLSLIGPAGAGVARAADVSPEPYFEVATKPGEVFVAGVAQSEPYFDFATGADKAVAKVAPQSERPVGLLTL